MIDIHAHLLPGIDDGARSMDQALNMARQAVRDGTRVLVVTPHHLNGVYANPAQQIRAHCAAFRAQLAAHEIPLTVLPGAECHLVHELPHALREGTAMTLADQGRSVLVELPAHHVPHGVDDIIDAIRALGLQPIIAHPERNTQLCESPQPLHEWVESGCLAQVTAQSCSGRFGPQVRATARYMVQHGLIHFVASDAHRDRRRVPELSEGRTLIEEWTNPDVGGLLAETFPAAVVQGEPIETQRLAEALIPPSRRWLSWLRWW